MRQSLRAATFAAVLALVSCGGQTPAAQRAVPAQPVGSGAVTNSQSGNTNPNGDPRTLPVVDANNKAPVVEPVGDKVARYGTLLAVGVMASDPENDLPLTYELQFQGDVLPKASNTTGIFSVDVPADIGSGVVQALVAVSDAKGKSTTFPFKVSVQGNPVASPIKQAVDKTCEALTDPIQKATCAVVGAFAQ